MPTGPFSTPFGSSQPSPPPGVCPASQQGNKDWIPSEDAPTRRLWRPEPRPPGDSGAPNPAHPATSATSPTASPARRAGSSRQRRQTRRVNHVSAARRAGSARVSAARRAGSGGRRRQSRRVGAGSGRAHHLGGVDAEVVQHRPGGVAPGTPGDRPARVGGGAGEEEPGTSVSYAASPGHAAAVVQELAAVAGAAEVVRVVRGDVDRRLGPDRQDVAASRPVGAAAGPGRPARRRTRPWPRPRTGRRQRSYGAIVRILNVAAARARGPGRRRSG